MMTRALNRGLLSGRGRWSLVPLVLTVALVLLATPSAGQVIFESSFDQDDTGFFSFDGPADSRLLFDTTRGIPEPGSMRIERDSGSSLVTEATTACLPYDTSRTYRLRLHSLQETTGGACVASWTSYRTPDCSDSPGLGPNFASNTATGVWQPLETSVFFVPQQQPPQAYRFHLMLGLGLSPAACNFDNITITAEPNGIPTLGVVSLAALAAAIMIVAVVLLRRFP